MEHRRLGRTGLKVSTICLGTMQFGWTADESTSHDIMDKARELGCNFFDTADIYTNWADNSYSGRSEEIVGTWLAQQKGERGNIIIATKVRGKVGQNVTNQGLSRHHIMNAVQNSLARLQTDYIDLYQVHFPDEETPLDETLETLNDLVRSGRVRYIGCSNYPAWLLAKALWISDVKNLARFDSVQPHYNLVHRDEFERELRPLCLDQGIGVIPYSPLAGGFLTGKYQRDGKMPDSQRTARVQERYMHDRGFSALEKLQEISAEHGATAAQGAIAWLLAQPAVTSAIIGANSLDQLTDTMQGSRIEFTNENIEILNEVSK